MAKVVRTDNGVWYLGAFNNWLSADSVRVEGYRLGASAVRLANHRLRSTYGGLISGSGNLMRMDNSWLDVMRLNIGSSSSRVDNGR